MPIMSYVCSQEKICKILLDFFPKETKKIIVNILVRLSS